MDNRAIKTPKIPATIFLIFGVLYCLSVISAILTHIEFFTKLEEVAVSEIIRLLLLGLTNLFMSSTLFLKNYNNKLIVASALLTLPNIFALFSDVNSFLIGNIVFGLLFTAFTYIMIKMPETPVREEVVKFRFIIPLLQFVLLIISSTDIIRHIYYGNSIFTLIPLLYPLITGLLPILYYIFLVDWLATPYK